MCASSLGSYQIGDRTKNGHEIKIIHGQSVDVFVFDDTDGRINWETREEPLPDLHAAVLARFGELYSLTDMVRNKKQQRALENSLARALFLALSETEKSPALKDTDGNYLAVCLPRGAAENRPRLGAGGNFISITVLSTSLLHKKKSSRRRLSAHTSSMLHSAPAWR